MPLPFQGDYTGSNPVGVIGGINLIGRIVVLHITCVSSNLICSKILH